MTRPAEQDQQTRVNKPFLIALLLLSPVFIFLFGYFLPPAMDWAEVFYTVARRPLHPYETTYFVNPPWIALLLAPVGQLPYNLSQGVNNYLNLLIVALVVMQRGGNKWSVLLALTSAPFLSLVMNGSIEWLPSTAFLFQNGWGLPLLIAKPQGGICAALIWFKRANNKFMFVLPAVAVVGLSFLLWPGWLSQAQSNIEFVYGAGLEKVTWNFSLWPWAIPLGLVLLFFAWKKDDELLATLATYCTMPYFTFHSLVIAYGLLAARSRRWGLAAWVLLWLWAIIRNWATFQGIVSAG